jgi:hypothetical protein
MRPIALVSSLGGIVLLGLAGCGDDRSARRDDSWRDWPSTSPASEQAIGSSAGSTGANAAGSTRGSSAGMEPGADLDAPIGGGGGSEPASGPIDTGTIPSQSPVPGGDVRSGDHRDYRWDNSSDATPIGSSPGISGANYGGSTVIRGSETTFSPRDTVIVGGGGGRGSSAGMQPGGAAGSSRPMNPDPVSACP